MNRFMILTFIACLVARPASAAVDRETVDQKVARYYSLMTGLDPRSNDIEQLRQQSTSSDGNFSEEVLFEKLFAESGFIDNRLAKFISVMSNEEAEPFEDVDDFQASLLLGITNEIDYRDLLSKPYYIESIENPGSFLAPKVSTYSFGGNLKSLTDLNQKFRLKFAQSPKPPAMGNYVEGILTTNGFARRSIKDGTNRRAIRAIYDLFLCSKIETWKDASLDDFYVGKDVDRKPGDNPETYQSVCRSCHAPMDAQRGALAYYDYDKIMDQLIISDSVSKKYLQNSNIFPQGTFVTSDARWENLLTDPAAQAHFGWRGGSEAMTGKGLLSFSTMIANARQFQTCMAQRIVATFCEKSDLRKVIPSQEFKRLVDDFREDGYKMKKLIRKTVSSEFCQ